MRDYNEDIGTMAGDTQWKIIGYKRRKSGKSKKNVNEYIIKCQRCNKTKRKIRTGQFEIKTLADVCGKCLKEIAKNKRRELKPDEDPNECDEFLAKYNEAEIIEKAYINNLKNSRKACIFVNGVCGKYTVPNEADVFRIALTEGDNTLNKALMEK